MELPELFAILRRRWWLVVLVPAIVAVALIWQSRVRPYQTSLRATILIPGDTEIPGNSERPELMVMDDVPSLVTSRAFAEGVRAAIGARPLTVEQVQASLSAERYSRVLTVFVTGEQADEVRVIGDAVAATLPDLINRYLIPSGGEPATVQIIDPPGEPSRSRPNETLKILVVVLAGFGFGGVLAIGIDRLWTAPTTRLRST